MDAVTELAPQPHRSAEVIDLEAVREARRRSSEAYAPDRGSGDPFPWAYTFHPPA
ncbi:MAG TPA: hypothetical protein VIO94_14725 [Phenylobacterium sp.]